MKKSASDGRRCTGASYRRGGGESSWQPCIAAYGGGGFWPGVSCNPALGYAILGQFKQGRGA